MSAARTAAVTVPSLDVLLFEVNDQRYAIPIANVVEVVHAVAITPLPGAPLLVEGVVNVRGRIVPVLDTRSRFRQPPRALDPADHFIVATAGARTLALRVDRAVDLAVVDAAAAAPSGYLAGVAEVEGGLVLIRDVGAFLSEAEDFALEIALGEAVP
jgi:purine-binding chemotaxis protein CheW